MPLKGSKGQKSPLSVRKAVLDLLCFSMFELTKKKASEKSGLQKMVEPAGIEPASVSTLQSVLHT